MYSGVTRVEVIHGNLLQVACFQKVHFVFQKNIYTGQVFWPPKGTGRLTTSYFFLIFDGKQHCEKNWFRGC